MMKSKTILIVKYTLYVGLLAFLALGGLVYKDWLTQTQEIIICLMAIGLTFWDALYHYKRLKTLKSQMKNMDRKKQKYLILKNIQKKPELDVEIARFKQDLEERWQKLSYKTNRL